MRLEGVPGRVVRIDPQADHVDATITNRYAVDGLSYVSTRCSTPYHALKWLLVTAPLQRSALQKRGGVRYVLWWR